MKTPEVKITSTCGPRGANRYKLIEELEVNGRQLKRKPVKLGSRRIFLGRGIVVKVDRGFEIENTCYKDWTVVQSTRELAFWNNLEEEDKKYFPEPLAGGKIEYDGYLYPYIVQKKISGYWRIKIPIWAQEIIDDMVYKYAMIDVEHHGGSTYNRSPWNCCVSNGKVYIYDYAEAVITPRKKKAG